METGVLGDPSSPTSVYDSWRDPFPGRPGSLTSSLAAPTPPRILLVQTSGHREDGGSALRREGPPCAWKGLVGAG